MPVKNRFAELHDDITAWRRDFHEHPEILFETHRTSATVAEKLRAFGCDEVVEGIGRTGVVGVIKGKSTASGKVIGLRADMDALPIHEQTGVEYASKTPNAMHACGHDGHTAMLLGAAQYLAETRNFDGTAVVIFQPAEEGGGGGREMCEDGMMDRWNIQEVYGMHNWPGVPTGKFGIRSGPFFAATDLLDIEIEGLGGHAAKPNETIDTTVVAAHIVTALQTIASRNADPVGSIVVSITSFETSSKAFNVIPQRVNMLGTVRTLSNELRDLAEKRVVEICEGIANTFGATARVNYKRNYPVMVNHDEQTEFAAEVARSVSGDCDEAPLVMGGEDFAFMLEERPGAYILVGNGDSAAVHHPMYNFNDEAIPAGCSWWAGIVEQRMPVMN
ncbi:amidohydrolase [Sulfitobacter mediterraneus]|uniref:M20 aminoacylase family protein n=1 Tax=Sulfitobacter mediterraneus TaxID=83219 RepID=UPI001939BE8C|nr:M20 aminoacylase family protein [Sulfitobacter mediterraneus]MBM1557322.1 amidohydrolase [Sulfitobacter mediterraneus]MBM1568368.1 amidohydrolase [Sulfitobacter mediterraneus]MBM1572029.1 amidohydrolase [Sulfitobacter mediterraneus]MBM1575818.1 amidohydrolase [Sulfitobacter mediterraneus]MBM1580140.1 amidohydrolase [Sulfitobacter mediterraneus]